MMKRSFLIYTSFMTTAVAAELIMKILAGRLDDDDDGEYADDILKLFFGAQARAVTAMIPFVGQSMGRGLTNKINSLVDGQQSSGLASSGDRVFAPPGIKLIETAISMAGSAANAGKFLTDDYKRKDISDTRMVLGAATGLPLYPISRPLGYLKDIETGKAETPEGPLAPIEWGVRLTTGYSGAPRK